MTGDLPSAPVTQELLDGAVAKLADEFDPMAGGFGNAPKFPPTMVLEFLRRYALGFEARKLAPQPAGGAEAAHMLARTTAAMAGGGMYDQLGGGFARYSVDRGWVVPHFEKMLYDNAQLVGLYARLGTEAGDRVARETADFLVRELRTPEGGFASALDADSPDPETGKSVEGAYYAWTPAQLTEVLGADDGAVGGRPVRRDRGRHVRARHVDAAAAALSGSRPRAHPAGARPRAACSRLATSGRAPASTTRWSPPGTGSPSAASATPGCSSASRTTSTPATAVGASCSPGSTWRARRRRSCGSPATAWPDRMRGCWRTTAASPRASCHSCRRPETRGGSPSRPACSTTRSRASAPRTAASSTPMPMPRRSSLGPGTRATTRRRAGSAAWSTRW